MTLMQRFPRGRIELVIRYALALAFLCSSIPKLRHPHPFLESVYSYQMVDARLGLLVAMVLPWAEFVVAVCLFAGVATGGAMLAAAAMGLAFTVANTWALFHGLAIDCGCFGSDPAATISPGTVALSAAVVVTALSGLLLHVWSQAPSLPSATVPA